MTFDPSTYVPEPRGKVAGNIVIPELRNKAWLQTAINYPLSDREIAELLGCSQTVVSRWAKRLECVKNLPGWDKASNDPRLNDAAWLRHQYDDVGRTSKHIARELSCGLDTLSKKFEEFGIGQRGKLTIQETEVPEWENYHARLEGPITKRVICLYAAQWYNVAVELIEGPAANPMYGSTKMSTHTGKVWHAKRVSIWLCWKILGMGTADLTREFSYKQTSSMTRAIGRIDLYVKSCPAFATEVQLLTNQIKERR